MGLQCDIILQLHFPMATELQRYNLIRATVGKRT